MPLRLLLTPRRRIRSVGAQVVLNAAAAVLEAFVILLVAPLAAAAGATGEVSQFAIPLVGESSATSLLVIALVAVVAFWVLRVGSAWLHSRFVAEVESESRREAYRSYLAASFAFQQSTEAGYLHGISGWTTSRAAQQGRLVIAIGYAVNLGVMVLGALLVEPVAAGAIIVAGGVLALCFRPLVRRTQALASRAAREGRSSAAHLSATESLAVELHVYAADGWGRSTWADRTDALVDARRKNTFLSSVIRPTYQAAALLVVFGALALAVFSEAGNAAALGAVALLLLRSLAYGQALQQTTQRIADTGSVDELLQAELRRHARHRREHGDAPLFGIDSLEFTGVGYQYPDADEPALQAIDLRIDAGERIGVVGPSGAGKSTLAQLLLRLRVPTAGTIRVNGIDASAFDEQAWAGAIGFVPQASTLLAGTVRENVTMFRPAIGDQAVHDALHRAGLAEVVAALPLGIDTPLGNGDRSLSGGQLQRLGIARALAGSPSVLVLDEPTSALDVDNESIVSDTLADLDPAVTVVVIAHRASTLSSCHRIIVVEDGGIVADGAPSDIREASGFYRRTVRAGVV